MTSQPLNRRTVLVGGGLLAAAVLVGCTPGGSRPSGDLRARLAEALRPTSPTTADLVQDPRTTLTPVTADWLPGWQIVDVTGQTMPHPRRFYAALSDRGRVEVLTGNGRALSSVMIDAGVRVDSAEVAASVGAVYLDATRDFRTYAYRISRVHDIEWIPRPTEAEQTRRDTLLANYRDRITPLRAEGGDEGWQVVAWMVEGRDLTEHQLALVSGLPASDRITTAERDIPVAYSA